MNREYELAKEKYAKIGIDTETVIDTLKNIPVSLHCWQGDDVTGFDSPSSLSGGIQVTGNYPGKARNPEELMAVLSKVGNADELIKNTQFGSCVFANKPGDGSAREQAASCQKVLGGFANICYEFATKRYRSNCINWGILPFTLDEGTKFPYEEGDYVFVGGIREAIIKGQETFDATVIRANGETSSIKLYVKGLTEDEKEIILDGCLMNYYAAQSK